MSTSRLLKDSHVKLQQAFMWACEEWKKVYPDLTPFITASYRSREEQHCLFLQPNDKKDNDGDGRIDEADEKVTNADAGQSAHNYDPSLAIDFAIKQKDGTVTWNKVYYKEFSDLMLKYDSGLKSGRSWGDFCHMELKNWKLL